MLIRGRFLMLPRIIGLFTLLFVSGFRTIRDASSADILEPVTASVG